MEAAGGRIAERRIENRGTCNTGGLSERRIASRRVCDCVNLIMGVVVKGEPEPVDHWYETGTRFAKSLGVFLNGRAIPTPNERGEQILDDSFYVVLNAHHEALTFTMLDEKWGSIWTAVLDTADEAVGLSKQRALEARQPFSVEGRSLLLLRRV